jgi:hypothetical protein
MYYDCKHNDCARAIAKGRSAVAVCPSKIIHAFKQLISINLHYGIRHLNEERYHTYYCFLEYYVVKFGRKALTFRRTLLPLSSGYHATI